MAILMCSNPNCQKQNTPAAQYQTKLYGDGMRVHNETKTGMACTICGDKKVDNSKKEEKKSDKDKKDKKAEKAA